MEGCDGRGWRGVMGGGGVGVEGCGGRGWRGVMAGGGGV